MSELILKIYQVGNGDCLVLTSLDHGHGAIDFCRLASIQEHPINSKERLKLPNIVFACLTHPHQDHMASSDEMAKIMDVVARNGGEFWHTVADMAELLRLYQKPEVKKAFRNRELRPEFRRLADVATMVKDKFPRERIRFIAAEPGKPVKIYSDDNIEIEVLAPSKKRAIDYIRTVKLVEKGEIKSVDDSLINETSAVLAIRCGDNKVILGGDALDSNWKEITSRRVLGVQAVKASHHGSDNSFYSELWDDLFGQRPGVVLVSANGVTRPTKRFFESFGPRKRNEINDAVYCTGPIDYQRRPEFLDLQFQIVLDYVARRETGSSIVPWGTIEVRIPRNKNLTVSQPYTIPI